MWDQTKHRLALLVTDDAALETAIRHEAAITRDDIGLVHSHREGMSTVLSGCSHEEFAMVDLERRSGGRHFIQTAGGLLPVLAITSRPRPWLSSMARHRRIAATLQKPFSSAELGAAWQRVRKLRSRVGTVWQ